MNKLVKIFMFLLLSGCSAIKKEVIDCPKLTSFKEVAEVVVKSEKNIPVYIGIRGVQIYCTDNNSDVDMELSINIRAIRKDTSIEDYVPVNISVVSLDASKNEYERDDIIDQNIKDG
ncbi:hypothetical protein N9D25_01685 [Alphaproteobacteria bacterium]|nr:hypothetical protein [Alphaproteobacteria bacterium]